MQVWSKATITRPRALSAGVQVIKQKAPEVRLDRGRAVPVLLKTSRTRDNRLKAHLQNKNKPAGPIHEPEVDSKSTGLCPREFKSRRCRFFLQIERKKNPNTKNDDDIPVPSACKADAIPFELHPNLSFMS